MQKNSADTATLSLFAIATVVVLIGGLAIVLTITMQSALAAGGGGGGAHLDCFSDPNTGEPVCERAPGGGGQGLGGGSN